jgi:hypothetical protein
MILSTAKVGLADGWPLYIFFLQNFENQLFINKMNALQKVASGYICKNDQPKVLVTLQIKKSVQSSIGNKPISLLIAKQHP